MVSQPESLVMPTEWISLVVKDSAAASVGLKICEAQVLLFHFVFFVTRLCSVLGDGSCAVYMSYFVGRPMQFYIHRTSDKISTKRLEIYTHMGAYKTKFQWLGFIYINCWLFNLASEFEYLTNFEFSLVGS